MVKVQLRGRNATVFSKGYFCERISDTRPKRTEREEKESETSGENGDHKLAGPSAVAELAEIDALPCSEIEAMTRDGQGQFDAGEHAFGMGGHVIGTFKRVGVVGFALSDETVEDGSHVGTHIGVGIFVEGEPAACVLHKKVHETLLRQGGKLIEDFVGHEMESSLTRPQGDFDLLYHICWVMIGKIIDEVTA